MTIRRIAFALAVVLAPCAVPARAGVTITIEQQGSDVVAAGGGTLNLTDLTLGPNSFTGGPFVSGQEAAIQEGALDSTQLFSAYTGFTGPSSFGPGSTMFPSSGAGDTFGIQNGFIPLPSAIFVPLGYVSGDSLSATDTYSNTTISGLGLIPGTYTWTWGTGANADSLTVRIVPAAVPEPSPLLTVATAALAGLGVSARKRRAG